MPDGFKGPDVKSAMRSLMAAVRTLGDSVVKSAGIGTMSNQNADAVAITGGTIGGNVVGYSHVDSCNLSGAPWRLPRL